MPKSRSATLVDAAMLGLVIVWGANFAVIKSALAEFSPLAFNALRFTLASAVLLSLTWYVERDLSLPRRDWKPLLLLSFLSNFIYQNVFILGIARTRASNSSLLLSTTPIFVALMGTLLGSERLHSRNWLGILTSFFGILLLIGGGTTSLSISGGTLVGDLLVLCGTVLWAHYTIAAKDLMARNSVLKVTAWFTVSTAPLLVLIGVPDLLAQDWQAVSAQSWLGLAYSGILAIGVGFVVWTAGVKRLGSARTSLYSNLPPLVAMVVSWLSLGERMNAVQMLGAVAILVGVVLGRYRASERNAG